MTKKHFIALADHIKNHNERDLARPFPGTGDAFSETQIATLVRFCRAQNPNFNEERWIDYIAGRCGPSGGRIERETARPLPEVAQC